MRMLIVGASGYIGGRLPSLLEAAGHELVLTSRRAAAGRSGWPYANLLWRVRGLMDRFVGGIGMRLGRRAQDRLRVGDALDFWRVEALRRPELLRLRAEMKVPGRAWLQYEVVPTEGGSRLVQTAFFEPKGLPGLAYWYLLYPAHGVIFRGMVRVLAVRAEGATWRGTAPGRREADHSFDLPR